MQEKIRNIRVRLDEQINLVSKLEGSRELSLAKTHLEESRMMLGKVLSTLGEPNPYPQSFDPKSSVIEKAVDLSEGKDKDESYEAFSHVAKLKYHRDILKNIAEEIYELGFSGTLTKAGKKGVMFSDASYLSCIKAVLWLGMELGNHRDVEPKDKSFIDKILNK